MGKKQRKNAKRKQSILWWIRRSTKHWRKQKALKMEEMLIKIKQTIKQRKNQRKKQRKHRLEIKRKKIKIKRKRKRIKIKIKIKRRKTTEINRRKMVEIKSKITFFLFLNSNIFQIVFCLFVGFFVFFFALNVNFLFLMFSLNIKNNKGSNGYKRKIK